MKHGIMKSIYVSVVAVLAVLVPVQALPYVPGSPCESVCSQSNVGALADDVVCLDHLYSTTPGSYIKDCTSCLLNSTVYDAATQVSDVMWGLYNLRYTLSECMFAFPEQIISISSPCQVTCARMNTTILYNIGANDGNVTGTPTTSLEFCQQSTYSDLNMNNCATCYGFIPQQLFLANFVQALHIACRDPPALGETFYPDGQAIFNESAIAGPPPPTTVTPKQSLSGWKLGLVIALPVVGGTILFAATCFCCFRFTRKRRANMAAEGRMSRFHDGLAAMSGSTYNSPETGKTSESKWGWVQTEEDREMKDLDHQASLNAGNNHNPGAVQNRRYNRHSTGTNRSTPVTSNIPTIVRDDAGPGADQQRDPYLHEQYFGIADGGEDHVRDSQHFQQYPPVPIPPAQHGGWS